MNALYQGIILTGGKSKRMGNDKALLKHNDSTFLALEMEVLKKHTEDLLIVGDPIKYKAYAKLVVNDLLINSGPAAGIFTGLHYSTYDYNIVLSCDVPQIGSELIQLLKNTYNGENVMVCKYKDQIHPLIGIYNKKIASHIQKAVQSRKLKLLDILDGLDCSYLNVPENMAHQLININTKDDYNSLL